VTADRTRGSLHSCQAFSSHGKQGRGRTAVVVAQTVQSWPPRRAPSTFSPHYYCPGRSACSSSKPTAPHRASGGLRRSVVNQWHSHPRATNASSPSCTGCTVSLLLLRFLLHISLRPRHYPARRPSTLWRATGRIAGYLYAGNSTTRSTSARSRTRLPCGKGSLRALALPPARRASTPVIRCPRHFPQEPQRPVETINLHALPAASHSYLPCSLVGLHILSLNLTSSESSKPLLTRRRCSKEHLPFQRPPYT
jgi:hypothetical protein